MPCQLDELWATSTWPQRYILSSYDVNMILSGTQGWVKSTDSKHWTRREVNTLLSWMHRHAELVVEPRVLYRGTRSCGLINPLDVPSEERVPENTGFLSSTTDSKIAKEFSGLLRRRRSSAKPQGRVHVLHLMPGCMVYDMMPEYTGFFAGVQRERETVILPGHEFRFIKQRGARMHWAVRKKTKPKL
jgi:hypothetical protein